MSVEKKLLDDQLLSSDAIYILPVSNSMGVHICFVHRLFLRDIPTFFISNL